MAKILIVEDDPTLAKTLKEWLAAEKFELEVQGDGKEALLLLQSFSYDAIVLDWNLPGMTGAEVCRQFRNQGGNTPIMMLTGKNKIEDKEQGFGAGADDYMTKPFEIREFLLRLRALLRRPAAIVSVNNALTQGDISINTATHEVLKANVPIHLVRKEYALLEFLMNHVDQVLSAETILERVWPASSETSPESVRIYIARLRNKIDTRGEPSYIQTVHGFGYKFASVPNRQK